MSPCPRCPARRRLPPARGAALLLAMLILVLVATITAGMVWQQSRAIQVEAAERARTQAAWILSGALDWARLILREDARGGRQVDSLDEPWATPLAEARLSSFLAADQNNNVDAGPEAFISGAIVDAQSRWNLRNLADDQGKLVDAEQAVLLRLCSQANLSGDVATRIAAGLIQAWKPPTGEAADAPLAPTRLAELAWLGIEPLVLERLAPWLDLLPVRTPVNVNTAPREVLVAVIDGLDSGGAGRIVQQRQRQPFATLDQVKPLLPAGVVVEPSRLSVGSSFFEVTGRLRLDDRALEERSLLQRRGADRNAEVVVLRRERLSLAAAVGDAAAARRP